MSKDLIDDRFGRFREIPLALAQKGHCVCGICLSYAKRNQGWIKDGPVLWNSINASRLKVTGLVKFIIESLRIAKKFDVIWACSDSFYGVIGCVLGRILGVPTVFDIYDNFGEFFVAKLPIADQLYLWAIRNSNAVTCLSKAFANYISVICARHQNIFPIEFAVRKDLFKPLDKAYCRKMLGLPLDAQIFGTAGALYKIRDVPLLFRAFDILKEKYQNLNLSISGPRDFYIPRGKRIHDLGILPFEMVPYFINALDVAVICYANDRFGNYCFPQKTREIMACNVPLVASRVGSLKELLRDHPEWLFEPGDEKDLAHVIERRIADNRTDYAQIPTWSNLAETLESVFKKVSKSS